jgi:mRNA-degrading endonuclease RelE of RelBE toxin-antitoxin system
MAVSTIFTDSFIQSATGLDANGSKSVWQFIEKFRANPAHPSLSLERVKEAASKNVWSGRVGRDLRAILYQEDDNWLILYVGHHDDAYGWAASRQVERHVKTGQLQVVELPASLKLRGARGGNAMTVIQNRPLPPPEFPSARL